MADELDQLALNRMVQALQPQVPLPTPRPQVPLPIADPRGTDFTDRVAGQLSRMLPKDPVAVHPNMLMQKNGYQQTADDNVGISPQDLLDTLVAKHEGLDFPMSYGAGRNKIYTPTMQAPPAQDVIANWLKNNPS
jgi:hypothetical protein